MQLNFFLTFTLSFLISLVCVRFLKNFAKAYNMLLDKQVPLVGGLGIGISFFTVSYLSCFSFGLFKFQYLNGFFISSGIILIFGLIDDMRGMSIFSKFLVQIMATAMLILSGVVTHIMYIGLMGNIFITFFWVIGITNAFNHLDVMDGLAASMALIISIALCVVSFLAGNISISILLLIIIGSVSGFVFFNLPPAKVYLGNAGSHFLGFILSAVAIVISYATAQRKIALFVPILILGLPIFDTMFLVFMRAMKGRSIFKKSDDHLALRFLKIGYSKRKTLSVIFFMAFFFIFSGLLLASFSNSMSYVLMVCVIVSSLILAKKMGKVQI